MAPFEALSGGAHLLAWAALARAYELCGQGEVLPGTPQVRRPVLILAQRRLADMPGALDYLSHKYALAHARLAGSSPLDARSLLATPSFMACFMEHIDSSFWRFLEIA
jgi:hypothetical protein